MDKSYKKGMIIGSLISAGVAAAALMSTKKGREWTHSIKNEKMDPMMEKVRKYMNENKDVKKEKLKQVITSVVDEYIDKKQLGIEARKAFISALQKKWDETEKGKKEKGE